MIICVIRNAIVRHVNLAYNAVIVVNVIMIPLSNVGLEAYIIVEGMFQTTSLRDYGIVSLVKLTGGI